MQKKIKHYLIPFVLIICFSCAYYNTMFNALKLYDEGNQKIANSKDGNITADIRKNFNDAIDKCWTLINIHGDSSSWADDALLLIGKSHYLIEEYNKAELFLGQFLKKYPKSDLINEAKIWYAKVLVKNGNEKEALAQLKNTLLEEMNDDLKAEALNSIGSIYLLREEYDEAIQALQQSVEISDDDLLSATSQYQIGKIYFDLGQFVKAIENLNYVLDYDPPEEIEFSALMLKVDAQIKLEKVDVAINTLSQMLRNTKILDKHSEVEAKMGDCFVLQGKKEYATDHYFDVIERYPRTLGSAWATYQLADLMENYYTDADSARKMYLKVKQQSGKSIYADSATTRANLLKTYLDLKTKIKDNRDNIIKFTELLLDTLLSDTIGLASDSLSDSLELATTVSDSDSTLAPVVKDSRESITKKLQKEKAELAKNHYKLAEFFLLNMQNYDSAAAVYIDFIDSEIDTSKIAQAYYALSYIYDYELKQKVKADSIDKIILNKFPESEYAEYIISKNSPEKKKKTIEIDPLKEKYKNAEQDMFDGNYYKALDEFRYIANNDSGNQWGGKARYAISWIYEKKLEDINKAIESYTLLAKEYPNTEYSTIAKNKIKEPKIEVPVDTSKVDTAQIDTVLTDSVIIEPEGEPVNEVPPEEKSEPRLNEREDSRDEPVEEERNKDIRPQPLGLHNMFNFESILTINKEKYCNRFTV